MALIDQQEAIDALWKALYAYEDKTEKQFLESDELDVYDWFEHRIFVQNMNDIDRQTILNLPSVQPKRGKWIERESGTEDKENGFETVIVCSRCDFPATTFYSEDCESRTQIRTDFCPNCGADMRKRGEADGQS